MAVTALKEPIEPSCLERQDPSWPRGLQGDQSSCKKKKKKEKKKRRKKKKESNNRSSDFLGPKPRYPQVSGSGLLYFCPSHIQLSHVALGFPCLPMQDQGSTSPPTKVLFSHPYLGPARSEEVVLLLWIVCPLLFPIRVFGGAGEATAITVNQQRPRRSPRAAPLGLLQSVET